MFSKVKELTLNIIYFQIITLTHQLVLRHLNILDNGDKLPISHSVLISLKLKTFP